MIVLIIGQVFSHFKRKTGELSASGSRTIMGGSASNLTVNSTSGLTGALRFGTGGNTLNNF